jgi:Protein of unknown function (DUF4197)
MDRRQFSSVLVPVMAPFILLVQERAWALSFADLTQGEASQGLKTALEKGALAAINTLGRSDGFMGNEKVRIRLPGFLEDASKLLKSFGQGARIDELVLTMNRAAEAAVPWAKDLLLGAVKSMSITDAKNILMGGETSVTQFFADKTRAPLAIKFLPVVTQATEKVGLVEKYNQVAGKVASLGLMSKEDANIQQYVTGKTLDGLFLMIEDEEKKIRQDPAGTGSAVLKKVFGALN